MWAAGRLAGLWLSQQAATFPADLLTVCYSFPSTTDKDSLKGNLLWLFITEIMPLQSAIPKAKETRKNTLIQLQGQVPGRGAVWSSPRLQRALREQAETFQKINHKWTEK